MKRILKALLTLGAAVLVLLFGVRLYLTRTFADVATPPPGYKTREEIAAAIATGGLKLVNMNPPLPDGVTEEKGVEYGRVAERALQLDLYSPKDLTKPVPALLFIHGGAWKSGRREDYRVYTTHFATRGYVTATMSYRLSKEAPFPAAVEDAKCAVRWLRANAAKLHVDPERIVVLGGSAGGHLSMMIGYSPGKLEGIGGHNDVSSRVAAVVDIYGPVDLTTPSGREARSVKSFLGGKSYADARELWEQASPVFQLRKGAPPTLILHGTLDDTVPIEQADLLAAKLKELEVPVEYERLEGWPHTMDASVAMNDYFKARIEAFVVKHVGPGR